METGALNTKPSEHKEQLLKLYPEAYCIKDKNKWSIYSNNVRLSVSWISEENAWNWALTVTNNFILSKFKG